MVKHIKHFSMKHFSRFLLYWESESPEVGKTNPHAHMANVFANISEILMLTEASHEC